MEISVLSVRKKEFGSVIDIDKSKVFLVKRLRTFKTSRFQEEQLWTQYFSGGYNHFSRPLSLSDAIGQSGHAVTAS